MKAFNTKNNALAEVFLKTVDGMVTEGEVASKCADTDRMQIVWSETLLSTSRRVKLRI
jgi:hypothetical protein